MNKKILTQCLITTGIITVSGLLGGAAYAHGYVESPPARGYQGQLDIPLIGWSNALNLYGGVIQEPQSLEAPKGFPEAGPPDKKIASANEAIDSKLDAQSSTKWKKSDINIGANTFTWKYTAAHRTTKWHYYMTKVGWNQNDGLDRNDLELIGTVNNNGSTADTNLSHTINIPSNRSGYHVVLAVWDVADTVNAFYNVIDVNVKNTGVPILPEKPDNLKSTNITKNSVSLTWDAQIAADKYNIYRNGSKIRTVDTNAFDDIGLKPSTEYRYEIQAVSSNGAASEKSDVLKIKTLDLNTEEKPTTPSHLHSMGVTNTSISLMWKSSTHSSGIAKYEIYRDNVLIGSSMSVNYEDKDLKAATEYKYQVKAISNDGQMSDLSYPFIIKTASGDYREFKFGSFTQPELYTAGEKVSYNGNTFKVLVTHKNYGDLTWAPDKAPTLFVPIQ